MKLPDTPEEDEIPEITEIDGEGRWGFPSLSNRHVDELQTFVGNKKNKIWIGSVVNHWKPGILLWIIGDLEEIRFAARSKETFQHLWCIIRCWHSFWYVSDGYSVYPCFIEPEDHLVSKTYMTSDPSEVPSLWLALEWGERASVDKGRRREYKTQTLFGSFTP